MHDLLHSHNIIQIHNNVLRDWQYFAQYSSHSNWVWGILCRILSVPQNNVMDPNNVCIRWWIHRSTNSILWFHNPISNRLYQFHWNHELSSLDTQISSLAHYTKQYLLKGHMAQLWALPIDNNFDHWIIQVTRSTWLKHPKIEFASWTLIFKFSQ